MRLIDLHTHILPVDDGIQSLKESILCLEKAEKLGFEKIVFSPHYVANSKYAKSYQEHYQVFRILKKKAKKIKIELFLTSETMICENMLDLLKEKKIKPINKSNYLLVEIPHFKIENEKLEKLKKKSKELIDYRLILVHPERCVYFQEDFSRLNDFDFFYQVNVASLVGKYGKKAKELAIYMLKNKKASFLATDLHTIKQYDDLKKSFKIIEKIDDKLIEKLFFQNPLKVILNQKII